MAETLAELLARIGPKLDEDWTEICLRPDLVAEAEELDDKLTAAQVKPGPRRNSDGTTAEARRIAKEFEAVSKQIAESAVRFTFRGLPKDEFRALCDQHPPRRGDQGDAFVGYDRNSLGDALVKASVIEPIFDETSWAALLEVVTIGEWNEMRRRAEKVNGSVVTEAPKSLLASRILSSRASTSKPLPASE